MTNIDLWVPRLRHIWIFTFTSHFEYNLNYQSKDTSLPRSQLCTKNCFWLLTYLTHKPINVHDQILNTCL